MNRYVRPLIPLLALAALAACKEAPPPPAAEPQPILQGRTLRYPPAHPQLALLKTAQVQPAASVQVELPAHLVWNEERTQRVVAPFAGRVAAIRADIGQKVQPGSLLLTLASPEFGVAQADAAKARADLQLAEQALRRQRELFDAGIVARKDFEQVQAEAARARAESERALARTRLYGGAQPVDQQLAIRSDIRGVVVERNVNPAQELRPDSGLPPLFVISDPSQLWVQIDAREADVSALRPGAGFELIVPALGNSAFSGRVAAVADAIDPDTRTIKVRGVVDNADRLLKAGMLGVARVQRQLGDGFRIPASAMFLRGALHWVFVQSEPGAFELREVEPIHEGAQEVVVSKGLKAGDVVVVDNGLLLARELRIAEDAARAAQSAAKGQP